jgi:hypothetical protein
MRKAIALAAAGIVLLSACGSSSGSKKAGSTKAAGASATTAAAGSSNTSNIGSFCDFQKSSGGSQAAAAGSASDTSRADLEKAASQIDKAADFAPAEIRSDMRIFIDGYLKPFYAELARVNYDFTKINFTALSGLSRPDVQAASQRIAAYYQAHCSK